MWRHEPSFLLHLWFTFFSIHSSKIYKPYCQQNWKKPLASKDAKTQTTQDHQTCTDTRLQSLLPSTRQDCLGNLRRVLPSKKFFIHHLLCTPLESQLHIYMHSHFIQIKPQKKKKKYLYKIIEFKSESVLYKKILYIQNIRGKVNSVFNGTMFNQSNSTAVICLFSKIQPMTNHSLLVARVQQSLGTRHSMLEKTEPVPDMEIPTTAKVIHCISTARKGV